jgi:hypothetical protein
MSIIGSNILAGASGQAGGGGAAGYQIQRSLRFNSSDSAYLSRTPASAGNRKTWTLSWWMKLSALNNNDPNLFAIYTDANNRSGIFLDTSANYQFGFYSRVGGTSQLVVITDAVLRDHSAWYHCVISVDTTAATASDRAKIYINGVEQSLSTSTYPSQNYDTYWNLSLEHNVGRYGGATQFYDGLFADIHFIDGQALTPTSFGEFDANGVWQPIDYAGSYGLVSVAEATGALPIYNTTGTYGTVKGSGTRTDTNSSSIVLAIPMDGANNGTTFTDESATIKGSGSPKSLTRFGDTKTVTAISKYYGSSGLFDGTGDYLSVAASADLQLGSSDFCFEFWWYPTSTGRQALYHGSIGTDWSIAIDYSSVSSQKLGIWASSNGTSWNMISSDSGGNGICNMTVPQNTWNHIAFTRGGNTFRVFLNGILDKEITASGTIIDRSGSAAGIGVWWSTGAMSQVTGYLQDFRIYKGVAKYTSNFSPVLSSNNSFKLPFSDNSTAAALGTDTSGNGNTWTVNNISVTAGAGNDSLVDSPTNGTQTDTGAGGEVVGNYATWNPIANFNGSTISNGNLDVVTAAAAGGGAVFGTIAIPSSGKYYWEVVVTSTTLPSTDIAYAGIVQPVSGTYQTNVSPYFAAIYFLGGGIGGTVFSSSGSNTNGTDINVGDVCGIAVNVDSGSISFYKNGVANGSVTGFTFGTNMVPYVEDNSGGAGQSSITANFGQRPFAYTAPSGFKALCTTNLPEPTIADGSTVMDVKTFTGNHPTGQSITSLNFSPDFVWLKDRAGTNWHYVFDTIRGTEKAIFTNATNAENTYSGTLTSFNSDGFTLGSDNATNQNGNGYVAWCWDAGSSTVTNTQGSITSQVRANASAGFSVVTYTGTGSLTATFGHGLGVTPGFFIIKNRSSSCNWMGYHSATGKDAYYDFNTTNAVQTTIPNIWGTSGPSSSLITVTGPYLLNNQSGQNYVCYAWSPVAGYSSFGSYTGNGSSDGPFVFTGHRSRFLMIKRTDSASDWMMFDALRPSYNAITGQLSPKLQQLKITLILGLTSHQMDSSCDLRV